MPHRRDAEQPGRRLGHNGAVIPIVTPSEMSDIDAQAPEPTEVLIRRAGGAVRREAIDLLGGTYGRRVVVLAGKGNNGNDGRMAAELLERSGVRTRVVEVTDLVPVGPQAPSGGDAWANSGADTCDLLIDAAFGTGFRGTWEPPHQGAPPVLAVDIPSGVDGLTGEACGSPWHALRTVTFAALKPGLVQGDGPAFAGEVVLADIGLDVQRASAHLVTDADVVAWIPARRSSDHKWNHAVWVVAGSAGMQGAGWLCARAAMRGGAGYVRASSPGVQQPQAPREAVGYPLPETGWGADVAQRGSRFGCLVAGPGLGRGDGLRDELVELCGAGVPVVLDADALVAVGAEPLPASVTAASGAPGPGVVFTPHDGEFEALMGHRPGGDRLLAARSAAERHGVVVLLKGPTTVVAHPDGAALVVRSGDARLATAGSGDVLSGLIGAHIAAGADPFEAAGAAAHLHGRAAGVAGDNGVVAGDLAEVLGEARSLLL